MHPSEGETTMSGEAGLDLVIAGGGLAGALRADELGPRVLAGTVRR